MNILSFDIGGSSVKYGLWKNEQLQNQGKFKLPYSWDEMKLKLFEIYEYINKKNEISGVAFSVPGSVNDDLGEIKGVSAIPYIHDFSIKKNLEQLFKLPVSMENDANCAALAEVWKGAAKDSENAIFFVIGTGVGGAIVINKKVFKGHNLFGGEFGYMLLNNYQSLSDMGSTVKLVQNYNKLHHSKIDGEELIELFGNGDKVAIKLVKEFFETLARGIYNLLVCFDPGKVIIGGGISNNPVLVPNIKMEVNKLLEKNHISDFNYELVSCEFGSDANLIGAVYHFIEVNKNNISSESNATDNKTLF